MAWETTLNSTSPQGQRVEYQQLSREGDSMAESRARVVVSGRIVVKSGYSSDGKTYVEYARIVREGYTPQADD